ncbi:MAG: radical SAM protein [PVC group bacterium]|nr:radical SAM protein [PVC group bacterium]
MKIVLVNIPWKRDGRWGVRAGSRWPHIKDQTEGNYLSFPFYLAYAAALLKKNGFDVEIIDAIAEQLSYDRFLQKVKALKPDLLLAETSTVTLQHDLDILVRFQGDCLIALCGPDIHIADPDFLQKNNFIDFILFGEYEATLLELAQKLEKKQNLADVSGIIYRNQRSVIKNNPRPLIADLDSLPWPLREQLPIKKYNDSPGDIPLPCALMWASRGCPFKCSFCLWPQVMYGGNTYRARSPKAIVDEMEYLVNELGFKSVYFDDDTWNIGRGRMLAFCAEIKRRKLNIPWAIMARAELMEEELLEAMRDAGLFAVKYGIESSSQQLIDNINKGFDLNRVQEVIKYTKYLGIRTHLTFTFGLPGETAQTVDETIEYALRLNPTSVQFSIATPFPGTRFYEEMEAKGYLLTKDLGKFDGNHHSVIRTEKLSAQDLQKAKQRAYAKWKQHCELRQNKIQRYQPPLKERFLDSLRDNDLIATCSKTMQYLLVKILSLPQKILIFGNKDIWIVEEVISAGDLKLAFGDGKIRVYWKDKEVSKDVGLTTSFYYGEYWIDSSQANWKLDKQQENKIIVKLKWDDVPLRQQWEVTLSDNGSIEWNSWIQAEREIQLIEYKAGIMLPKTYTLWKDDVGTGKFPRIRGWEDMELYNQKSECLSVIPNKAQVAESYPEIELKLKTGSSKNTYPQVQNTECKMNARLLQMRRLKVERFAPGIYPYFNLEINLKEEKVTSQSITQYQRRIPLQFIKEKISRVGLFPVLGKIIRHLHPKKLRDYYFEVLGILDGGYAYKGPSFVQIDLTNDCNNDCIGCWCNSPLLGDARIGDNVKQQTLPFEVVKQTIDDLYKMGTKEIYFAGGGEPFMHPQIMEIIEYVKMKGLRCYINTNFTLVTEDIVKRLAELKVDNLIVSIWAGTAKTYHATHPNKSEGMFYQIKGMLQLLNTLKQGMPQVNIYNVISTLNYQELEQMVEFAIETNSDSLEFTVIDTIPGATDSLLLTKEQRAEVIQSCGWIKERLEQDWKGKIEILQFEQFLRRIDTCDAEDANYDRNILTKIPCYIGWLFTRILADGNVNFCLKAHRIPVGNIYAHDFPSIWNSQRQQEFRKCTLQCREKDEAFFSFIGNDPKAKTGCFKSCDDLGRNIRMHKKMQSLTFSELVFLKVVLLFKRIQKIVTNKKLGVALKERLEKKKSIAIYQLGDERFRLKAHSEGVSLYCGQEELTGKVGLNTSVCILGLWYDSSKAKWEVIKKTNRELWVRNSWNTIPIVQDWILKIEDDDVVAWKVRLAVESKIEIEESKVGIILASGYKNWFAGQEKGEFPNINNYWKEMEVNNVDARNVGVARTKVRGQLYPEISLDFSSFSGNVQPQIQNSDRSFNVRIISARKTEENGGKVFLPGDYEFFSGRIDVRP